MDQSEQVTLSDPFGFVGREFHGPGLETFALLDNVPSRGCPIEEQKACAVSHRQVMFVKCQE